MNEADTCRKLVVPQLQAAGWDDEPHAIAEQRAITDGRIVPVGQGFVCKAPKRSGEAINPRDPRRDPVLTGPEPVVACRDPGGRS